MYVVATAGHVDHGKSTLIRALTGMEPDRWAEERRRGMTIDLGYAWTDLPTGHRLAFIDVPGHERFVTNMLAGVGQVPAVLLVIAADEGWRQQTVEHFEAMRGFGVRHLVVAISRADLADPRAVRDDTRVRLTEAGLADADVVAVSAVTAAGLGDLRAALGRMVARLAAPAEAPFRLWVDRSFSLRGAGTVVTGTLVSGRLTVGDDVEITPSGRRASIRRIESCKQVASEIDAVARVAVNLRGVTVDEISRGECLVAPATCHPAEVLDVELTAPLPRTNRVLHVGSATESCRIRPLGGERSRHCRLTLAAPLPVRLNDRGLLRDPGGHTAVGIQIKDIDPPRFRRRGMAADRAAQLAAVGETSGADIVRWRGWVEASTLRGFGDPPLDDSVRTVAGHLVSASQWEAWAASLSQAVGASEDGVSDEQALRLTGVPSVDLLRALVASDPDLLSDRARIRLQGTGDVLDSQSQQALIELEQRLTASPFRPPDLEELAAMGLDGTTLATAVAQGRLTRINAELYVLPDVVDRAVERLRVLPEQFTVSQARDALASSRRVTVPLLQHLDASRHTERVTDALRRLTR